MRTTIFEFYKYKTGCQPKLLEYNTPNNVQCLNCLRSLQYKPYNKTEMKFNSFSFYLYSMCISFDFSDLLSVACVSNNNIVVDISLQTRKSWIIVKKNLFYFEKI